MKQEALFTEAEDEWDKILQKTCGLVKDDTTSWTEALVNEYREISDRIRRRQRKNIEVARKMFEIVEKEKSLAEEERLERLKQRE